MVAQADEGSVIAACDYTGGGGELTVEVFSPRVPEPVKFTWSKSLKVGDAADEAAKALGYEAGKPTLLDKAGHAESHESSHRFSVKVATESHESSHPVLS